MSKDNQRVYDSANRHYRSNVDPARGETAFRVVIEQTDLHIVARRDLTQEVAAHVRRVRGELKAYITLHPEFGPSLVPLDTDAGASDLVRRMAEAGRACGVGPMAAVAGAIAQSVCERFRDVSPDILVENGGDIYMCSTRERVVGLLSDPKAAMRLGLRLGPADFPLSLCSSSGKIGHSLSFGQADLVAVRAADGALADAAATALANILRNKGDLTRLTQRAEELAGVGIQGVFARLGEDMALWGDMDIVALE